MPNDVGMLSSIREIRPLEIIIIKQTTFKHRWPLTQRSLALRVLSLDHVSYAASLIITWEARGGSLRGTLVQFDIYEAIFQPYTPQPNALIYRTRSRERRLPPPLFFSLFLFHSADKTFRTEPACLRVKNGDTIDIFCLTIGKWSAILRASRRTDVIYGRCFAFRKQFLPKYTHGFNVRVLSQSFHSCVNCAGFRNVSKCFE